MAVGDERDFAIGEWQVRPEEDLLVNGTTQVRLEPKVMDALVYLASRPGEVVSRADLEQAVWRGGVVGYDAVTGTVIKLRKALGDSAKQPRFIVTVPKRGYQLIAPVERSEGETAGSAAADSPVRAESAGGHKSLARNLAALVALVVLLVAAIWWLNPSEREVPKEAGPAQAAKSATLSIVVLPFENISNRAEQDPFADGITEDIITDLSGLSNLRVIASNTSFSFKGKQVAAQTIGAELDVQFVLEGSVRRAGDAIRLNAQLVETETGFQRWAKRYDRELAEVFEVQDELTASIVNALALELTLQERKRLAQRTTDSLAAYDHFQEGQRLAKASTSETNYQAQAAYRAAIEADPDYGRAYGALGYVLALRYRRGWSDAPQETIDRALELARKAVALSPDIPQTHWSLGFVHLMRREYAQAEAAVASALAVSPNYADGYGLLALVKNARGDAQAAMALIERGMRLNPYYTWDYPYNLGRALYTLGRYEESIEALEEAKQRNEHVVAIRLRLAASYVRAGRLEDAEWEVEEILVLNPNETLSHLRNAPIESQELLDRTIEDLRAAGLPE